MHPTKKNIPNKSMEWIQRYKYEAIVSMYKTKVQSLINDHETKIAIQNRRINILMDTIRQQKEIIDSFVLNRRPIEWDIIEDGINLERSAGIHKSDEKIVHKSQRKHSEQSLESNLVQCEHTLKESYVKAKDAILLAINIQPNFKKEFECNLCNKSFRSKRVLTVNINEKKINHLFIL